MTEDRREIERRLQALIEITSAPARCTSTFFKIATVIGFILLVGAATGCFFAWTKWENTLEDTTTIENERNDNQMKLAQAREDLKVATQYRDDIVKYLHDARAEIVDYKNKTEILKNKTEDIEKSIAELTEALETATKERDSLKSVNDRLKEEDQRLTKELISLEHKMSDLKAALKQKKREMNIWKIASASGLFLTVLGGLEDIHAHTSLIRSQERLKHAELHAKAFPVLSTKFENFEFWNKGTGANIERETCFHNGKQADLKKCINMSPTLTTIVTSTGYVFGIVLNKAWQTEKGVYPDDKSFAMSINHGDVAPIKDESKDKAFIVDSHTLLNFGNGAIVVSLDGMTGTAKADAYNVPSPYTAENFLQEGSTTFEVRDIKIERLLIK